MSSPVQEEYIHTDYLQILLGKYNFMCGYKKLRVTIRKKAMECINFTPTEEKKCNKENSINPTGIRNEEKKETKRPQEIEHTK